MGHRTQVAAAIGKARAVELLMLAPWAALASIWASILLQGGEAPSVALPIAFAQVLLAVGWIWADRSSTPPAFARDGRLPALLTALLAVWLVLQLFVFGSGMAADAWRLVGHAPKATLDVYASLAEMAKLCGFGALCIIGVRIGANPRLSRRCWFVLALGGALYFGWTIFADWSASRDVAADSSSRLAGTFLGPNPNAALAGLMAVMAWRRLWRGLPALAGARSKVRAAAPSIALAAILAALSLTALVMSGSRGGVIATLIGMACCSLATLRSHRLVHNVKMTGLAALLIAALAVSMLFGAGEVADRMRDASAGIADRQGIVALYMERLPLLPWSGLGLGTFRHFNNVISSASDAERLWTFGAMHNVYLQWIFEGGYIGAGLMFGLVGALLWNVVRTRESGPNVWSATALGASALILTHGAIDFDLQVPAVAGLWALLLGLGLGEGLGATSGRGVHHEKPKRQRTGGIDDVGLQRLDHRFAG